MNDATQFFGSIRSRWTGITILSVIAAALFVALVFLGIGLSQQSRTADSYIEMSGRGYSQFQRELLRLQVLVVQDDFNRPALEQQYALVSSRLEYLRYGGIQQVMTEAIHEMVDRTETLWAALQSDFERWLDDPSDSVLQDHLSQLIADTEFVANDMLTQFAFQNADRASQVNLNSRQSMIGLGTVSVLFVIFVGLVIANIVRFLRERQRTENRLRQTRDELEQRVQERTAELVNANAVLKDEIAERERAEDALAKEHNLLRTVIDNLPDLVFIKDLEGQNILNNLADVRFVGAKSPQELAGKTLFDFFSHEVATQYRADELKILSTGQPQINFEEEHADFQGNQRWFLTTKVPVRNGQGEIIGLVGIAREITERKQAEAALAKERNMLRIVIDNLPDFVYVKDINSRFLLVNNSVLMESNLNTLEDFIGKTDFDVQPPEIAQLYVEDDQKIIRTGEPIRNVIEPSMTKQGTERWFSTTKVPLRDSYGAVIGVVGVSRDITEHKLMEDELAKERHLLRTVIDALPDLIYVKDRSSRVMLVNDACVRFVDISPEGLIGKWDFDFYPKELAQRYYDDEQTLMRTQQPMVSKEDRVVTHSGKVMWVSATKVPLRDPDGKVIGLVGVSRDITERRAIEEALAKERNLLRTVIDNLPDLVYVRDTEGRFVLVNDACVKFVGAAFADEIIGKTDFDFYAPEKAAQYRAAEQELIRSGQPLRNPDVFVTVVETGKSMWVSAIKVPLFDQNGSVAGLVGVSRDITERKLAEVALAEERNLLRTVIDNLPDLIYVKDAMSKYVLRNITGADLVGLANADEMIGKTDFDFFTQEEAQQFYDEEQTIIQTGQPLINRETLISYATGHEKWFLVTKVPLRDQDGRITGLVGINRDITERKLAEVALAEERNLLRTLIDNLPDYIYVKDTQGRWLIRNNTNIEAVFGVASPEALMGKTDFDFFPPELAQQFYDEEQAIIQSGQPLINHEVLSTLPTERNRWMSYTKVPLRDTQGRIIGIVGTTRDVTERKLAEQALETANKQLEYERAQLEAILDSMGEGVIYDENHQTRYINHALTQLTGYTVDEWRGALHPLKSDSVSEEAFEVFNQTIFESVADHGIWRGEAKLQRKDGSEFDAALTCTAVTGTADQVIGAVTVIRDISQEKALQEQKSRFVANASHELRTPIANLKTRLYLARKQPEKAEQHLQVMDDVVARMQRLVEDMLDVSRFERGLIPLQPQDVVLQDLMDSVLRVQQAEAERKQINLVSELPAAPLHIFADPERIIQVITNLLVNAINYTLEGGTVSVRVAGENAVNGADDYAVIDIQDTGIGIAPDQQQQVFQPFFRASQGVSGGTGLGLSIVKEILDLHGGEIGLESEVGHGTRFRVKLSLVKSAAPQ